MPLKFWHNALSQKNELALDGLRPIRLIREAVLENHELAVALVYRRKRDVRAVWQHPVVRFERKKGIEESFSPHSVRVVLTKPNDLFLGQASHLEHPDIEDFIEPSTEDQPIDFGFLHPSGKTRSPKT